MITHTTGTVIEGQLQLNEPLMLPDGSRVAVTVEAVASVSADPREAFAKGLSAWKKLIQEHPVHSGGVRFTRDELHERD